MASYKMAIEWMVFNDDTEWVNDPHGSLSVTACLVADMFEKPDEKVRADLIKARKRRYFSEIAKNARNT